jgi:hypothetical protein
MREPSSFRSDRRDGMDRPQHEPTDAVPVPGADEAVADASLFDRITGLAMQVAGVGLVCAGIVVLLPGVALMAGGAALAKLGVRNVGR